MGRVNVDYLLLFLQSPLFRNWITASASSVTGSHSRAKSAHILKQLVPVPPMDKQEKVVTELAENTLALKFVEAKLSESEALVESARASVLHRAFSGPEEEL
jgi:hypothetical protein